MKKIIVSLAAGLILIATTFAFADSQIKLFVNGKEIQSEVSPQIVDGQVLVPAQPLAEALGVRFHWSAERNRVSITTDDVNHSKPIPEDRREFLDTLKEELKEIKQSVIETTYNGLQAIQINGQVYFDAHGYSQRYLVPGKPYSVSYSFNNKTNELSFFTNEGITIPITKNSDAIKIYNGRSYINSKYYREP